MTTFYAPGRTELGGNHTDHNCGKVLAAPVNLRTTAAVSKRDDGLVVFESKGFGKTVVKLDSLEVRPEEAGTTAALIRGVAAGFAKRGGRTGGFEASVTSTVFAGSGLVPAHPLRFFWAVSSTAFTTTPFPRMNLR